MVGIEPLSAVGSRLARSSRPGWCGRHVRRRRSRFGNSDTVAATRRIRASEAPNGVIATAPLAFAAGPLRGRATPRRSRRGWRSGPARSGGRPSLVLARTAASVSAAGDRSSHV